MSKNQKNSNLIRKNIRASAKTKTNKLISYLINRDIDWIFIGLFTFLFLDINIWLRIAGSIGASYVYKMIINSIMRINNVTRNKK
jgi:hypothetical protein